MQKKREVLSRAQGTRPLPPVWCAVNEILPCDGTHQGRLSASGVQQHRAPRRTLQKLAQRGSLEYSKMNNKNQFQYEKKPSFIIAALHTTLEQGSGHHRALLRYLLVGSCTRIRKNEHLSSTQMAQISKSSQREPKLFLTSENYIQFDRISLGANKLLPFKHML